MVILNETQCQELYASILADRKKEGLDKFGIHFDNDILDEMKEIIMINRAKSRATVMELITKNNKIEIKEYRAINMKANDIKFKVQI